MKATSSIKILTSRYTLNHYFEIITLRLIKNGTVLNFTSESNINKCLLSNNQMENEKNNICLWTFCFFILITAVFVNHCIFPIIVSNVYYTKK